MRWRDAMFGDVGCNVVDGKTQCSGAVWPGIAECDKSLCAAIHSRLTIYNFFHNR
jgi:hypothetical protein